MTEVITGIEVPNDLSSITPERRVTGKLSAKVAGGDDRILPANSVLVAQIAKPGEWEALLNFQNRIYSCKSADEIATLMQELGFKGDRSLIGTCPIANMARSAMGGVEVEMDEERLAIKQQGDKGWWNLDHTPAMTEFIHKFDQGAYPHLVA